MSDTDSLQPRIESLQRQITQLEENLRLIAERKAEFVLPVEIPLQLVKEEERQRAELADKQTKLKRLLGEAALSSTPQSDIPSSVVPVEQPPQVLSRSSSNVGEQLSTISPPQQRRIRILFLAANPTSTTRLQLDEEIRAIDLALRTTALHDRFELLSHWAVRASDLQALLLRHQPDIVHISGHGNEAAEIMLQDEQGQAAPVPVQALGALFAALKDNIKLVLLNACYAEAQARAIANVIDCVIGMSAAISDQAAIRFSAAFYQALGYGRSVKTAFDLGRLQIDLENLPEQDTPQLIALRTAPANLVLVSDIKPSHSVSSPAQPELLEQVRRLFTSTLAQGWIIAAVLAFVVVGTFVFVRLVVGVSATPTPTPNEVIAPTQIPTINPTETPTGVTPTPMDTSTPTIKLTNVAIVPPTLVATVTLTTEPTPAATPTPLCNPASTQSCLFVANQPWTKTLIVNNIFAEQDSWLVFFIGESYNPTDTPIAKRQILAGYRAATDAIVSDPERLQAIEKQLTASTDGRVKLWAVLFRDEPIKQKFDPRPTGQDRPWVVNNQQVEQSFYIHR